ncbi:MAG: hypothetical protein KGJ13_04690 [Patescibacteria group bacterium]|nr:hypothetical protein [Patescibacteria group bacterium]
MIPNVLDGVADFQVRLRLARVTKTQSDYDTIETSTDLHYFSAIIQPIPPTRLLVKPEGQRTWKWFRLWAQERLKLDDYVADGNGKQYRVMTKQDWDLGGGQPATAVNEYEIVESSSLGSEAA